MYAHIRSRNEVKSQIRSAQAKYDQQLIEKLQTNPKALYGYMRNKLGLKPRIGQLVKSDGSLTDSDGETAEVLNNFFQSVFTNECSCTTEIFSNSISQLSDITFTESEVFVSLSSLKPNKASGPDNLHSQVLKNCAESLTKPLFLLFSQSMNTGMLPSDWRRAHITPIFKKGSKVDPTNNRPVSLTSQVIKVLEALIRSKMVKYLDENEIVTSC